MVSAVEYFEKCAGARMDNYVQGGSGHGLGADLAARTNGDASLDDLDAQGLQRGRNRGRALEAIGSIGLGAAGALGLAGMHHSPGDWFSDWDHTKSTLGDFAAGSSLGIVGGMVPSVVHGYTDTNKLIEEAKQRRLKGDQAPDKANSTASLLGGSSSTVASEAVAQQ